MGTGRQRTLLLFVGAVGAVTRLIAARIQGKEKDPAVLVLDPKGEFIIPLLGGHSAGAEQRAREIAMDLGGQAVITGACAHEGRLPLDAFGEAGAGNAADRWPLARSDGAAIPGIQHQRSPEQWIHRLARP